MAQAIFQPKIIQPDNTNGCLTSVYFELSEFKSVKNDIKHTATSWQLANDRDFESIIMFVDKKSKGHLSALLLKDLEYSTTYYIRAKYHGNSNNESDWSDSFEFKIFTPFIAIPEILFPFDNSKDIELLSKIKISEFSTPNYKDNFKSVEIQIASDQLFNDILSIISESKCCLNIFDLPKLSKNTIYHARVRYESETLGYSEWSKIINFTTEDLQSNQPKIINPDDSSLNNNLVLVIRSSDFVIKCDFDKHYVSSWEISTDIKFQNIITSSYHDETNLTSWITPKLDYNFTYYVRVKYKGRQSEFSNWSIPVKFETKDQNTFIENQLITNQDCKTPLESITPIVSNSTTNSLFIASCNTEKNNPNVVLEYKKVNGIYELFQTFECPSPYLDTNFNFGYEIKFSTDYKSMIISSVDKNTKNKLLHIYEFNDADNVWLFINTIINNHEGNSLRYNNDFVYLANKQVILSSVISNKEGIGGFIEVYKFNKKESKFTNRGNFKSLNIKNTELFGYSMSVSNDETTIAICSPKVTDSESKGNVSIYIKSGDSFKFQSAISFDNLAHVKIAALDVEISSKADVMFVLVKTVTNNKSIYVYNRNGVKWSYIGELEINVKNIDSIKSIRSVLTFNEDASKIFLLNRDSSDQMLIEHYAVENNYLKAKYINLLYSDKICNTGNLYIDLSLNQEELFIFNRDTGASYVILCQ